MNKFYFRQIAMLALLLSIYASTASAAQAAFGLTTDSTYYTVDTGAGLVFKIRRVDFGSNTQSPGDIASLFYNGVEYQDQSRGSQINSGFDYLGYPTSNVTVDATTIGTDYIKITVTTDSLTHYYIARKGYPYIYMGTYFTVEPVTGGGLCRYILRMQKAVLPNGPPPSELDGTDITVESSDVFGFGTTNTNTALIGQTRSKHYSNMRLIDWSYIGAYGPNVAVTGPPVFNVGLWMVRDNYEGGSGGPFYRCLLNQGTSTNQEITYIVNYGEIQTEAFRTSILDCYTLVFTNGAPPALPLDTSWFPGMAMTGYVPASGRGRVTGIGITGRDTKYAYTVGFSNSIAQYWAGASAVDGSFNCAGMLPGDYTMTVYKNELGVYTGTVTVTAGGVTSLSGIAIVGDPSAAIPIWRIGDWDGSPKELLNGDKVDTMHPSDVRMSSWTPGTYIVGTSTPGMNFPCYQWVGINGSEVVQFNLAASQLAANTVRIGITTAYAGARPQITINSGLSNSWTSAIPAAPSEPKTRSMTVGSYRGNNVFYTYAAPASAFVAGTNTLTINPVSGSTGTGFLSPGYSIDSVDLIAPTRIVAGTATLQGWMGTGTMPSLIFTLTPTNGTAGTVTTQTVTPTATGAFTLTGVPAGTYTLGIKGDRWLKKNVAVSATGGNVSGLSVPLLAGDINGDNAVNGLDISAISAAFRTQPGDAQWNPLCDLNGDGVVNGLDISIASANFRKQGDP